MRSMIARNLKVFFRDRAAVFFSLLAVLIIIGLYVLFLGDVMAGNMPEVEGAKELADNWIMAGLLAVTSVTTVMGAFGNMVNDKTLKIEKDFHASPISKGKLVGGYVISSFLIGVIMTFVTFALAELYIVSRGGSLLPPMVFLKVAALILFTSLCNTAMVSFIVSFIKSQNAFGTISSVIGTLIGFLTGIYMPVGVLPEAVQVVIKVFPVSHAALLMRQVMMKEPMQAVFAGVPSEGVEEFREMMGMVFRFGSAEIPVWGSIAILVGAAVLFCALSVLRFSMKRK